MEKLYVLGTGGAMVTHIYNTCFALGDEKKLFLVDCGGGNGILRQMERLGLSFSAVHDLFISHAHADHLNGAIWVIRKITAMMMSGRYEGTLRILCEERIRDYLLQTAELMLHKNQNCYMGDRIVFDILSDHMELTVMGLKLEAMDICSQKLRQFGFILQLSNGAKLSFCGDEPIRECCYERLQNSDWLLCEAFCTFAQKDVFQPYEKYHSTALDAGRAAKQLNAKKLVLWHTEDRGLLDRRVRYTSEAAIFFDGSIFVPEDLTVLELDTNASGEERA